MTSSALNASIQDSVVPESVVQAPPSSTLEAVTTPKIFVTPGTSVVGSTSPSSEATESIEPPANPTESLAPEAAIENQADVDTNTNTYSDWLWWLMVIPILVGLYLGLRPQRKKR